MQPLEVPETLSRFNTAPERDQQGGAQPDFDWLLDKVDETQTVLKSDVKDHFSIKWKNSETGTHLNKTQASSNQDNKTTSTEQPDREEKGKVASTTNLTSTQVVPAHNQTPTELSSTLHRHSNLFRVNPIQDVLFSHARLNSHHISSTIEPSIMRSSLPCNHIVELNTQLKQIESHYHTAKLNVLLSALHGSVSRTIHMLSKVSVMNENDDSVLKATVFKQADSVSVDE